MNREMHDFQFMPNGEELPNKLVYRTHRTTKRHLLETTLSQKPKPTKSNNTANENETTILMYFKINNVIFELFQLEEKEPHCIFLHTRNPQTKEKKLTS